MSDPRSIRGIDPSSSLNDTPGDTMRHPIEALVEQYKKALRAEGVMGLHTMKRGMPKLPFLPKLPEAVPVDEDELTAVASEYAVAALMAARIVAAEKPKVRRAA